MVNYTVEPKAMEHRCQCCGEIADDVFCDDCKAHMSAASRTEIPDRRTGRVHTRLSETEHHGEGETPRPA